jgi:hypothetical protein
MAKHRKTLDEEAAALEERVAEIVSSRRKTYLRIYLASLMQRLKEVDYASERLGSLSSRTTESSAEGLTRQAKRDFYANCFWALAYSVLDILAHVVNTVHRVVTDESKVSFLAAAHSYSRVPPRAKTSGSLPVKLTSRRQKIENRQYFKRLQAYRQCCLHRRAVCVSETVTTTTVSMAYADTTSGQEPVIKTVLCDDPNDMKPKFAKGRDLENECATVGKTLREDITTVLRLI